MKTLEIYLFLKKANKTNNKDKINKTNRDFSILHQMEQP